MASTPTVKNILGRALRETGAAMKEYGRAEVCFQSLFVVICVKFVASNECALSQVLFVENIFLNL